MELLYNPDLMPEDEIRATFVARHELVDELADLVARQPDGAGVQHVVLIAPRGMGKTTILLMVRYTLMDRGLDKTWQSVKLPEESYGIYDLADFWMEIGLQLAADTQDADLQAQIEQLRENDLDGDDLKEAALAVLKDWRRTHGKRILALIDNLDMILEQINDEHDNARLRETLMDEGDIMLIGSGVTFFHEARAYDQPLYNFFRIYNLNNLRFEQMQHLMRQRAEFDGRTDFEALLKANEGRLRVLEYFTGGNPRLVLMLYSVVVESEITEVRRGLEKLLDEVTPYYKAKVESLPPQQRKILDHIARVSSRTHEGVTPTDLARAVRLTPNQTSAQLKRLLELGYVRTADLRSRSAWYTLSEPLYAIWHQMRFGRTARQKMQWLVDFLSAWYVPEEIEEESGRLTERFSKYLDEQSWQKAEGALDLTRLAEAGHRQFTRDLIRQAELDEPLFPLARALDYLLTGDEGLVKKLSPEMRGVVEQVIARLEKTSPKKTTKRGKAPRKDVGRAGPRKRTGKQLA